MQFTHFHCQNLAGLHIIHCITELPIIILIMQEISVKCGRAGDQVKMRKSPAKYRRVMASLILLQTFNLH